ncbi:4a-hydroxytetrahydrobiopterin dehydratase [Lichenifustis flavocetrariae]|uniref:Putative pterin-4-alpha-carbinolamine dehydratase n=1 Tax=Lichenifustis flavocetrariae TaxID=2949735 RepID=A0AA41YWB3_9HYPH|nr:4a-hydroxytetrahydrobiopterin dehydratase [Lichenifustis flavocetrariae]MCW6509771.1 4a-hydroxytetrahydrobiopterin dehydratase [Lichenifustis flavocetrariae]
MARTQALSPDDVRRELEKLDDWTHQGDSITKSFTLHDFQDVIAFLVQIAIAAEKLNHHPDISISYNKVRFTCCTHDAGHALTHLDFSLASRISQLAFRFLQMDK